MTSTFPPETNVKTFFFFKKIENTQSFNVKYSLSEKDLGEGPQLQPKSRWGKRSSAYLAESRAVGCEG